MSSPTAPQSSLARAVLGSLLIGAASGLRSQFGSAAVATADRSGRQPHFYRHPGVRTAFVLAVAGEIVADKLPQAGSRLKPGPLATRVVLAAVAAGHFAHARDRSIALAGVLGAGAALASAKVGHDVRVRLATKVPDLAVAIGEDVLAAGMALAAVRML
jgi:uncharacterized membrane protein